MINRIIHILSFSSIMLLASLFTSCGLIDMEFDENVEIDYDMQLDRDTVYVTVGDSFVLHPVFSTDSVINREVFFASAHEDIAYIHNDTIKAAGEGETVISATSVMNEKTDSCRVFVLPPWEIDIYKYSSDMVAYVTATVDGVPLNPETQMIAAFVGAELRGIGEPMKLKDSKTIVRIRIYGYYEWDDGEPTAPELVRFVCYDREKLMLKHLSLYIPFDGETHGRPSAPLELTGEE